MAFTEFYCDSSTGSNVNAGDNKTLVTTANNGTFTQGGGAGGNDRYVAASGTPFAGASIGDAITVYSNFATATSYLSRITAVNSSSSVDLSLTTIAGTRPANGSTYRATIGGVWKGPNGSDIFPFGFITAVMRASTATPARVNFKDAATYTTSTFILHSLSGPVVFQGYTTTPGDGGKASIDCNTAGAGTIVVSFSGVNLSLIDFKVSNSGGSSGTSGNGIQAGAENLIMRCVVTSTRASGFSTAGIGAFFVECEAYGCNTSNTALNGGFSAGQIAFYHRCIAHDNTGSNNSGFTSNQPTSHVNCISDSNGQHGFLLFTTGACMVSGCDAYNNGGDGINIGNGAISGNLIENCNLVKNGGWGINGNSGVDHTGLIANCAFGSGTQANTSGQITIPSGKVVLDSITYAANVTPWVDPANGDFRINLAAAQSTGRGGFTQVAPSYAGTIGYPDIGAGQALISGGGGSTGYPASRVQTGM